jgi:hypothetical protein
MYVRLAFAVAAHLEPEILIVDEVLAVGDMQFQKKCLGKMSQASRSGKTVLFVSHNMTAVKSLCSRGILLERGGVTFDGGVNEAVNRYLNSGADVAKTGEIPEETPRIRDIPGEATFRSVRIIDAQGNDTRQVYFGYPIRVRFVCDVEQDIPDGHWELSVSTTEGVHVTCSTTLDGGAGPRLIRKGRHEVTATIQAVLLPNEYTIDVGIHHQNGMTADFVQRVFDFWVLRVAEAGDDHYPWPRTRGLVRVPASWDLDG